MGWLRELERAQADEGRRERGPRPPSFKETSTPEEERERQLRIQGARLGIRAKDYIRNGKLNVESLEDEIVRRMEARRQGKDPEEEESPQDRRKREREEKKAEREEESLAARTTRASLGLTGEKPDPFGDEAYNANQGDVYDRYLLDMNEDVSTQAYRAKILFEDRNDRTRPSGGRTRMADGRRAGNTLRAGGSTPVKTSAQAYMRKIYSMDPAELEAYQRDLYAAGFYGSVVGSKDDEPIWGAPDEPTKNAVRALSYMTMSFKGTKSILEVLDLFKMRNDADGDGIPDKEAEEKRKPVISLTSQVDLAQRAQDTAVDIMGRRLSDPEAGGAVGGYNALESGYQYSSQMADIDNTGGTFTAPPTPGAYAEQQLRKRHGAEVDSYSYLKNVNTLLAMVGLG